MEWKVQKLKSALMTSYLLLMTFFINEIQVLPHRLKKCVNSKEDYIGKINLIWYRHPTKLSTDLHIYSLKMCVCVCVRERERERERFELVSFYGFIVGYLMSNTFYTYISNIYDLVWFGSISIIVGYLKPNSVYTYIFNIYDLWTHFVHNILKRVWTLFCSRLNGFKYYYIMVRI